jgi:hypothetical protein
MPDGDVSPVIAGIARNTPLLGVTLLDAVEYAPVPTAFTAATRKMYAVPLVSPVTVAEVASDVLSLNVVQVEPLFDEYCTT